MSRLPASISQPQPTRRDTIGLRSIVKYDPTAPRATTPIMVGQYVVMRRPLQDSVHTLYMIMDGTTVAGTSISFPGLSDCESAVNRNRRRDAASMADRVIDKAKKRSRRASGAKEAA